MTVRRAVPGEEGGGIIFNRHLSGERSPAEVAVVMVPWSAAVGRSVRPPISPLQGDTMNSSLLSGESPVVVLCWHATAIVEICSYPSGVIAAPLGVNGDLPRRVLALHGCERIPVGIEGCQRGCRVPFDDDDERAER